MNGSEDTARENVKRLLRAHGLSLKDGLGDSGYLPSQEGWEDDYKKVCARFGINREDLDTGDICERLYGKNRFETNVKQLIRATGKSMDQIAEETGLGGIYRWFRPRKPAPASIRDIASYFGLTPVAIQYGHIRVLVELNGETTAAKMGGED